MNMFFEMADNSLIDGVKYVAVYNIPDDTKSIYDSKLFNILSRATRVWVEKNNIVSYAKNRFACTETTTVDKKEFCWVKLKSTEFC